jgi:hypothetical protein
MCSIVGQQQEQPRRLWRIIGRRRRCPYPPGPAGVSHFAVTRHPHVNLQRLMQGVSQSFIIPLLYTYPRHVPQRAQLHARLQSQAPAEQGPRRHSSASPISAQTHTLPQVHSIEREIPVHIGWIEARRKQRSAQW